MKDFIISEKPNKFICKLCNKPKGSHKANTFNCPLGKGAFKNFHENQFFTPKKYRIKKEFIL